VFVWWQRDTEDGSSPESSTGEVQSQGPARAAAVQTPISAALSLMQKMEGVARLLGGASLPGCALHDHS
jgi:hypothetical protein